MLIPAATKAATVEDAQNTPGCIHAGMRLAITASEDVCPFTATLKQQVS